MSTTGHENEAINVEGLKASLKKGGNIGIFNEAICSTAGSTAAKITNTTPPSFTLSAGAKILVKFTYAISAENSTLQVGSNTAKPIYYKGAALPANLVKAGTSVLLAYDGTSYNVVGDLNTDTTYSTMGASGSTHAGGLVPDTPSTAGTTKFLREDGSWQEPSGSIPSQTGNNGKFLTTNGSAASWAPIPSDSTKADKLPMTGAGAATENNFVAIDANGNIKDSGKSASDFLTQHQSIKTINSASIVGTGNVDLQTPLTFDSTPTENSNNPVTSGGISTAISNIYKVRSAIALPPPSGMPYCLSFGTPTGFGFDLYGYSAQNYVHICGFFSAIGGGSIKNLHITHEGSLSIYDQGNFIIYYNPADYRVYMHFPGWNAGIGGFAFPFEDQPPTYVMSSIDVVTAPDFASMTKLFELKDYNGQANF